MQYTVGTSGVSAKNHAICDGPHVVAVVQGAGYPTGKGWHPRTEKLTADMVAKLNAPDLLPIVKSMRLMLYAYDGVRQREGWGPNPELTQCIRNAEAAIAIAEDPTP